MVNLLAPNQQSNARRELESVSGIASNLIADEAFERAYAKAGLVRREEMDDLALRVAQLEHRIRLLEHDPAKVAH